MYSERYVKLLYQYQKYWITLIVILENLICFVHYLKFVIFQEVWKQARNFPFYTELLDINYYVFQCINQNAEQEELLDEKRRLCDVQPFSPDLKVVLKADDVEDKILNGNISHLIDKGKCDL